MWKSKEIAILVIKNKFGGFISPCVIDGYIDEGSKVLVQRRKIPVNPT